MPNAKNADIDHKYMRHIEINKEWNSRQPFTVQKQEIFDLTTNETTFHEAIVDNPQPFVKTKWIIKKTKSKFIHCFDSDSELLKSLGL